MRCVFIGVGEAFDDLRDNTSVLVESGGRSLLLDCGFTAASAFWRIAPEPETLDAVWISHFHGDHWFGLPWLVARVRQGSRTRPLAIIGQVGIADKVNALLDMAYPNLRGQLSFDLQYFEAVCGSRLSVCGYDMRFAQSEHSLDCLALRLDSGECSMYYSGDGFSDSRTRKLASGCGLFVQEAQTVHDPVRGHCTVERAVDFAEEAGARALAVVHMGRRTARECMQGVVEELSRFSGHAFAPIPGDTWEVEKNSQGVI